MSRPSEDSLILASIALIEFADSRIGPEADALRDVADYLLRMSSLQAVRQEGRPRAFNDVVPDEQ